MSQSKLDTYAPGGALDLDGAAAMPRRNGELVFNHPWESRVFGIAVALCENGVFKWDEFRECLIAEISTADDSLASSAYYERFAAALERLLIAKGICLAADLTRHESED